MVTSKSKGDTLDDTLHLHTIHEMSEHMKEMEEQDHRVAQCSTPLCARPCLIPTIT